MDITVVLNAHREAELAWATMRSLLRSQACARAAGIHSEVLVVLDRSNDPTRAFFSAHAPVPWRFENTDYGDLGLARNHAAARARGRFIAFLDADDLFGESWLAFAFQAASEDSRSVVWHPAINVYFGASQQIFLHADMDDPRFDVADLVSVNQWTALAFAPTELVQRVPYRAIDLANQIGYEDWSWNEAVIHAGAIHKTVAGTEHFIRVKSHGSLVSQSAAARSVAWPSGLFSSWISTRKHREG